MSISLIIVIIVGYFLYQIYSYIVGPPDIPIDTSPEIKQIVEQTLPRGYQILSINSVRHISEFEGVRTPIKLLNIVLKGKTITNDKEMIMIAKPICIGIMSKDSAYESINIFPHISSLQSGIDCDIWGP